MNGTGQDSRGLAIHEAVVESLQDALLILDEDGRVARCNRAAEVLFGCSRERLLGQSAEYVLRGSSQGECHDGVVGSRFVMSAMGLDGSERPVEVSSVDLVGGDGLRCLAIRDLKDDRSIAVQAARVSILQQIVARATTALIGSDALNESMAAALKAIGEVLDVAHAFVLRVRTCGDAVTLTTPAEWGSPKCSSHGRGMLDAALLRDELVREQLESDRLVVITDSEHLDSSTSRMMRDCGVRSMVLLPIRSPDKLEGVLGFDEVRGRREWSVDERAILCNLAQALARSIERVRVQWSLEEAEKRSKEALARAESANEAKSEFLANVSHELRTPLTAIVGYADLAARPATSLQQRIQMCGRIQRSADFLLGLINDVLDLSKIESRKMAVSLAPLNVADLIQDVVLSLNWIAEDKGLEITVDIGPRVPEEVVSDATRLRQMLVNLISNGLKFTSEGSVRITVSYEETAGTNPGVLVLQVRDTGIGIRPEKLPELFSKFTQVHTDRKYGGTGLGLAITRHLARLLGGEVEVWSEFGEGSTFTISMPANLPETGHGSPSDEGPRSGGASAQLDSVVELGDALRPGVRLLVADDNEDNREIFRLVLEAAGANVVTVEHGRRAVEAVQESSKSGDTFDLALMDMNMPVLDGYEATRELRALGLQLPVVALTAFSMATDREKCHAAGCDAYLTKPIRPEVLVREVARRTKGAASSQAEGCGAGQASSLAGTPEYEQLLASFCRVVSTRVAKIRRAFEDSDGERLRALVHQLKGSAGCYGFADLVVASAQCEDRLRGGADVASVAELVAEIERQVAAIVASSCKDGE